MTKLISLVMVMLFSMTGCSSETTEAEQSSPPVSTAETISQTENVQEEGQNTMEMVLH